MPYLLLALGLIIGGYALFRFFMRANVQQIKAFFMVAISFAIIIAIFVMAVTGRLPAALALVVGLAPFVPRFFKAKPSGASAKDSAMTRDEACEILGVAKDATNVQIKEAYKKLMKKMHPDQEGSEWMAQKLNAAKDLLLKD